MKLQIGLSWCWILGVVVQISDLHKGSSVIRGVGGLFLIVVSALSVPLLLSDMQPLKHRHPKVLLWKNGRKKFKRIKSS